MLKFNTGDLCFVMSNNYTDGGYFGIVANKHWREDQYIVIRKIDVMSYRQVVPSHIMRKLTKDEIYKYKDDLEFLKDR